MENLTPDILPASAPEFTIGQPVFDGPCGTEIWRVARDPYWSPRTGSWWYTIRNIEGTSWWMPEERMVAAKIGRKMLVKILRVV